MENFEFNRPKFKQLVLYTIERCGPDALGNVKLHKVLYFADMFFYVRTGRALTGEEYIKQKFGPTARHLTSVLRELERDGAIEIKDAEYYGFRKKEYWALKSADPRVFQDATELQTVNSVIDTLLSHSARVVSEISHDTPWQIVEMGEPIPYFTAFSLMPIEITDDDLEWGIQEAKRVAAE